MVSFQPDYVCVACAHFQCVCVCSCQCFCPLCFLCPLYNPVCATVSLFAPTRTFFLILYMSLFVFVSNLFVCVNCMFVQLCLSVHSAPFCHCVSFYPPVFLPTVLCAQVSDCLCQICLCPLCFCCLCPPSVFVSTLVGVYAHSASARCVYS